MPFSFGKSAATGTCAPSFYDSLIFFSTILMSTLRTLMGKSVKILIVKILVRKPMIYL